MTRSAFLTLAQSRDIHLAQLMAALHSIPRAVIDLWTIAARSRGLV